MWNTCSSIRRKRGRWRAARIGLAVCVLSGCQVLHSPVVPEPTRPDDSAVRRLAARAEPQPATTEASKLIQSSFQSEPRNHASESGSDKGFPIATTPGTLEGLLPGADALGVTPVCQLDLSGALRLGGVENPTINLAQERIQEALAGQLAARSLLLPTINFGSNFRLHRGALLDDPGLLIQPNSQGVYVGAGAGAVGTGTVVVPGIWLFSYLADAIYDPAAAQQVVNANRSDALAVQNSILMSVSTGYLRLVGAQARLAILLRARNEVGEIARITGAFAASGEGAVADARRATANAELVTRQIHEAEGAVLAASAALAALLNQDPATRIQTPGDRVESFRLIDENESMEQLLATAVRARPELAARAAEIQEAETRVRQERARPWLPLVGVGYSAALFGGGSNQVATNFGSLDTRSDFGVLAAWNIQNMGAGNWAVISRARAVLGQANASYQSTLNLVRKEVADGQAAARATARQAQVAASALADAEEGLRLDIDRIRLGQGRPIEALDSFRRLLDARLELLRSIVAFDVAQIRLWVAMGSSPQTAAYARAENLPTSSSPEQPVAKP